MPELALALVSLFVAVIALALAVAYKPRSMSPDVPVNQPPVPPRPQRRGPQQYSYWPNPAMREMPRPPAPPEMPRPPAPPKMPSPPQGVIRRECDAPRRPDEAAPSDPYLLTGLMFVAVAAAPEPSPAPESGGGGDFGGGGASGEY